MRATLLSCVLLLIAVPVYGQDFERLDVSRDGYVNLIEASLYRDVARRFAQFDLDGDGRLSRLEHALLMEDNERRASQPLMPPAKPVLGERYVPSLSVSMPTPSEPGAGLNGATFVSGTSFRVGVQWSF